MLTLQKIFLFLFMHSNWFLGVAGGSSLLWLILGSLGPNEGVAVIHVTEADVVVEVGRERFVFEVREFEPLVVPLGRGHHCVTMTRDGEVLYQEDFEIDGGREVVLTAHDTRTTEEARPVELASP